MTMIFPGRNLEILTIWIYKLITRNPNSLPEHEITRRFFQMLEETIRRNPPYYLWTHNRWKRTKEEFDKRYEIKNGKVIPIES